MLDNWIDTSFKKTNRSTLGNFPWSKQKK